MNNLPIQKYESVVHQRDALEKKLADVVAENTKMRNAIEFATAPDMWIEQHDGMLEYRYVDWYVDVLNEAKETPATEAFTREMMARGVEAFAKDWKGAASYSQISEMANKFAAQLRKGINDAQ
ncbi:hypothetical protein [Hafnia alvei]|uniref:hypothetical protein n=1 Tax=Hafnia alvei TaxID=569 RepID=UPI00345C7391